jgi:hypothetical protein
VSAALLIIPAIDAENSDLEVLPLLAEPEPSVESHMTIDPSKLRILEASPPPPTTNIPSSPFDQEQGTHTPKDTEAALFHALATEFHPSLMNQTSAGLHVCPDCLAEFARGHDLNRKSSRCVISLLMCNLGHIREIHAFSLKLACRHRGCRYVAKRKYRLRDHEWAVHGINLPQQGQRALTPAVARKPRLRKRAGKNIRKAGHTQRRKV